MCEYAPKFLWHHELAKWQDADWAELKQYFPRGTVVAVIDYAENYTHSPRMEHQSKWVSSSMTDACRYAAVLMLI